MPFLSSSNMQGIMMGMAVGCMQYPSSYDAFILNPSSSDAMYMVPDNPPPYTEKPVESAHLGRPKSLPLTLLHRSPKLQKACPACYLRYLRKVLRAWVGKQRKPYSAITVHIDRLTSEQYEENDLSGIVDVIEVIRIQQSGPTEAARAIRKKLKYGSVHRQLRALTILDSLIQNAGSRFQRSFADEPLLERLRILPRDDMVDPKVRAKCNLLFRQWAVAYKSTPGLERLATLYKQLPQTKRPQAHQSKVLRETEVEAENEPLPLSKASPPGYARELSQTSTATSSSSTNASRPVTLGAASLPSSSILRPSKDKKGKHKPFNLEKEKSQLLETIASASVASTNLMNALKFINRENQRVSENQEIVNRFEICKVLRRQILRYIQLVESDQWIGSLLSANDELVKALMAFEIMDKSIEDDSDSDTEAYEAGKAAFTVRTSGQRDAEEALAGLSLSKATPPKPHRPTRLAMPPPVPTAPAAKGQVQNDESEPEEEDMDENDPFGDQNAVKTPYAEKSEMTWRDV